MVIDRKNALSALEKHYASGKVEFVPIYGRRRIGKWQKNTVKKMSHWT